MPDLHPVPSLAHVPQLGDGVVTLCPADARHAPVLGALLRDADVQVLTGSVHSTAQAAAIARGEADLGFTLERLAEIYAGWATDEDRAVWVIEADGAVHGEILLLDLDPGNRSCGLRLWLAGDGRDRGLGTRALTLVLDHAFTTAGLHRVGLEVYDHNPRARHVYDRLGFVHEGTLRQSLLLDGAWVDCHVMGLLAEEWRARRAAPSSSAPVPDPAPDPAPPPLSNGERGE